MNRFSVGVVYFSWFILVLLQMVQTRYLYHFSVKIPMGAFTVARKSCFSEYLKNNDRDVSVRHYGDGSSICDSNFERTVGIACESQLISDFIETRIETSIKN